MYTCANNKVHLASLPGLPHVCALIVQGQKTIKTHNGEGLELN
jgi:hypothetical protein